MKQLFLLAVTATFALICNAQEKNDLSMAVDFKNISGLGTRMQSTDAFQSYKAGGATGTQFYNTTWVAGSVTTTNNETINNYLLLYDKVRQELFIRPKDTNLVIQADKSQVKSFNLAMDKPHVFVKGSDCGLQGTDFLEVLVPATGSNYALYKLTKTTFEKADYNDVLKVRNGEVNDAFVDNVAYYIYHNGALTKMALKQKAVQKALPGQEAKTNAFFTAHKSEDFNEQQLINLVTYLNIPNS